jgi:hypothetical protein
MNEPTVSESAPTASGNARVRAAATAVLAEAIPGRERGCAGGSDIFTLFNGFLIAANMMSGRRNLQGSPVSL